MLLFLAAGGLHLWFITLNAQGNLKFNKHNQGGRNDHSTFCNQVCCILTLLPFCAFDLVRHWVLPKLPFHLKILSENFGEQKLTYQRDFDMPQKAMDFVGTANGMQPDLIFPRLIRELQPDGVDVGQKAKKSVPNQMLSR